MEKQQSELKSLHIAHSVQKTCNWPEKGPTLVALSFMPILWFPSRVLELAFGLRCSMSGAQGQFPPLMLAGPDLWEGHLGTMLTNYCPRTAPQNGLGRVTNTVGPSHLVTNII